MTATKSNKKIEFDFELSRDNAPKSWAWYYIKPLNKKAHEYLLKNSDPNRHIWDIKRRAFQMDQRDAEELMEIIDQSEFNGNWIIVE